MQPRKRIFLGTVLLGLFVIGSFASLLWYFTFHEHNPIQRQFFFLLAFSLFFVAALIFGGLLGIVYSLYTGKNSSFFFRPIQIIITHLLPLVIRMGKLFHIAKDRVEQSFIEVNNALVLSKDRGVIKPEDVLILAPHCLQNSECTHRITINIKNCLRCGRCNVADLLGLAEEYGVKLAVVTGGTLARKVVVENRPRAIVAIACERDLTSGIQDIYPLPTLGVLNIRPEGPCFNTKVDLQQVRKNLEHFLFGTKINCTSEGGR